jgi:protein-tyrosine-phosphatase
MTRDDWMRFDVIAVLDPNVLASLTRRMPADHKVSVVFFNAPDGFPDLDSGGRLGFQRMFDQIPTKMKSCVIEQSLLTTDDLP